MTLLGSSVFGVYVTVIIPAILCASLETLEKEHGQWENYFSSEVLQEVVTFIIDIGKKFMAQMKDKFKETEGFDTHFRSISSIASNFKQYINLIYPGTHWCGDGALAKSSADLGFFTLTDFCCREHDSCKDTIANDETRNGLKNTGLFTRSNCACDEKFRKCLKQLNTVVSFNIGFTYFTILGPQCFKYEHPIITCKSKHWQRCLRYDLDLTKEKRYQWFDNPYY